jgi:hypothetical protein
LSRKEQLAEIVEGVETKLQRGQILLLFARNKGEFLAED